MGRLGALTTCVAAFLACVAAPSQPLAAKPVVEVAFVLDTTGSMRALIEGAKRKVWSIATSILEANPDAEIRMGLVAYRDIGDEYVTKVFDLTTDIQDLYANLLDLKARGGGDWPESVNEALHTAVTRLRWTADAGGTRILFLVGDAPPHMDYEQDTKYPQVVAMARRKGIITNAVQAGTARDTERVWREIAQRGDGRFIPIPQDGGEIVLIETPYDAGIIELQMEINGTVIPYGPRAEQMRIDEKRRQVASAPRSSASDMASYINKRAMRAGSAEAVTGGGDLVADVAAGRQKLDTVIDENLPESMRGLSAAERHAQVERNLNARRRLNERLSTLIAERDTFIAAQRSKMARHTGDSFDRAIEQTLRMQIKR